MKLRIVFALIGMLLSEVAISQQSYPIVCRGGGSMHFNYTPFSNLSPEPQIWISFRRGEQKAGDNWGALKPGECSWVDRTINQNEPDQIALLNIRDFSIQWQQGQVTGISSSLPYINALQDSNLYQTFNVYHNQGGVFIVSSIGQ